MEERLDTFFETQLEPEAAPSSQIERFPERYKIHQYWSRKPWYAVRACIEEYTKPGDRVLDPFIGSGVTAVEALATGRKIVGCDINPIAVRIARLTAISPVDLMLLRNTFSEVYTKFSKEVIDLYRTRCRSCGEQAKVVTTIWKMEEPTEIYYSCPDCGTRGLVPVSDDDRESIRRAESIPPEFPYPNEALLPENADVKYVHELFTARNLRALSILHHYIINLPPSTDRDLILLMFSATLVRCSKLIFVNEHRRSRGNNPGGVWGEKRYWIPKEFVENNVAYYFNERLEKVLRAKEETNDLIRSFSEPETFDVRCCSATSLSFLSDNSIDYCFTDPPYGGSIRYLSLSTIWNAWLGETFGKEDELIVDRKKNLPTYQHLLTLSFQEIYRVLKPGRHLSVTFHNSDMRVWNALMVACRTAGFELLGVTPQEPNKFSHNQIDMEGTVKTDFVITFRKPDVQTTSDSQLSVRPTSLSFTLDEVLDRLSKTKAEASTAEIYDEFLLVWLKQTFYSRVASRSLLNMNDIRKLLENARLKIRYETEQDYKGQERTTLKWVLSRTQ